MKVIRIADPDQIRPGHVVLVCLILATLAGSCLLTSGPHRDILHDGAVDWGPDSLLRAVVGVCNLQFSQTTAKGVAVKALVFGGGASLAMLTLAFALGVRPTSGEDQSPADTTVIEEPAGGEGLALRPGPTRHVPLLAAAQLMILAFGLWSLASMTWSVAPDIARGGAVLLAIQLMWAFALGLGLNRVAARWASHTLVLVCTLTAIMAIAYHAERNPTLRASYPVGNPLFLAACLIPGILTALGQAAASVESLVRHRRPVYLLPLVVCLATVAVMLYAFHLTGSRGPMLGLMFGVAALIFFALGGRGRLIVGLVMAVLVVAAGWYLVSQREAYSSTGRSATIRLRLYSWSYAFDLAVESPLVGHGQGGFVLAGDAKAAGEDALADPLALNARVTHAHNEWLETWCDLGSIGLVLVAGGLFLTLWAGAAAAVRMPTPGLRWTLISLLASLTALVVEEASNSALRFPGLPTIYFTVIGLIWAMAVWSRPRWMVRLQSVKPVRLGAFVVPAVLAAAAIVVTVQSFRGARASYEIGTSLARLEWERALEKARFGRRARLNPHDRLSAFQPVCGTYLHLAREYQAESFRQAGRALDSDPPDERLLALAEQNRQRSVEYVQAGLSEVGELLKISPASWNSGFWEQGFYRVWADFDAASGHTDTQQEKLSQAVAALDREIARRPFDPTLAVNYAQAQGWQVDLARLFEVLARPLRHNAAPPVYLNLLSELASHPEFDNKFGPIHRRASQVKAESPVDQWADPWAPEKLRLAAIILFTRDLQRGAERQLAAAAELYDVIRESAPLGTASCYAELADARYFADRDDPSRAIDTAGQAIALAPNSEQGRALVKTIHSRMVTYELSAGNEDRARRLLAELYVDASPQALDAELGARYSRMGHGAAQGAADDLPRRLPRWVERALELNPVYELGWEEAESVQVLNRALQLGADMRTILTFVEFVLQQRPDSSAFQELRRQLREALVLPDEPLPTSRPTDPLPADSLPEKPADLSP